VQPVAQVVGLAPGHRAVAAGEHAAAVADRQRPALRGRDHPRGPAQVERLGWGAAQGGWQQRDRGPQVAHQPAGVVIAVAVLTAVAGDHHTGERGVAGQPPDGLGGQRSRKAAVPARQAGLAEQAGQFDGDGQLGSDPAGVGELAAFQRAAGQLEQRIGAPLRPTALVLGGAGASQRLQRRQQRLSRLGLQQPIHRHHALDRRRHPQAAPLVLPAHPHVGGLRVGHVAQVGDYPAQPRRVEPTGGLHQHRLGRRRRGSRQVLGAAGQHSRVRVGELPSRQGSGGARQWAAV
jgi:hypothetical protein